MKHFLWSLLLLPLMVISADFELLKNGEIKASICAPEAMDETLKWFNAEFSKCSGRQFTVVRESKSGNRIEFRLKTEPDFLAQSKFTISFPAPDVMLIEVTPVSVRFALNRLLHQAGVRYLFPGEDGAYYPKITELSIPAKSLAHTAGYRGTRVLYADDDQWHLNLNAVHTDSYQFVNHNIHVIFPMEIYKDEIWSNKLWPLKGGKRMPPEKLIWDPCFSSQSAADEAIKNICAYFEKNPTVKTFSLGHNDGYNLSCECENCRLINEKGKIPVYAAEYQKRTHHGNVSESYFLWINRVAEGVLKKFPDKYFGAQVYASTLYPPDFKLNDRVIPVICTEAYAHTDPAVRAFWESLATEWSAKAQYIGIWEYGYGLPHFSLPHVNFKTQDHWLKFVTAKNGTIGFVEGTPSFGEGPKRYLYLRLFDEPELNLESELDDWCRAAVGKEAAPFLKEYYDFWEKFWTGRAVNTRWFQESKFSHYTALVPDGGYMDVLEKGDMNRCRLLMEKMLDAAKRSGDAGQQKRATYLMTEFEFYEAGVYRKGVEITGGSGSLNQEQAMELAENIPQILHYAERRAEITDQMLKTFPKWWGGCYPYMRENIARTFGNPEFPEVLMQLASHLGHTQIKTVFDRQVAQVQVPDDWKNTLAMLADLGSGKIKNIVPDGSFEQGRGQWIAMGGVSTEQAASGKQSFRFVMPRPKKGEMVLKRLPMQAHRNHWLSFKVYLDSDYPPHRAKAYAYILGINDKNVGSNYYIPPRVELVPGKWTTVTTTANPGPCAGHGDIYLMVEDMEKGDAVYVDDVIFAGIGNALTTPATPAKPAALPFDQWVIADVNMRKESERYIKKEASRITIQAEDAVVSYFSVSPLTAGDGDKFKVSLKVSGKGSADVGFFAYSEGWKTCSGSVFKLLKLDEKEQNYEFEMTLNGAEATQIRPFIRVYANSQLIISEYQFNKRK